MAAWAPGMLLSVAGGGRRCWEMAPEPQPLEMQFSGASHRPDFSTRRTPVPTSATAVPRTAPGSHPVGPGTRAGRVAPAAPRCLALPSLAPAVQRGGGRFTGCQSRGQRSAGVRKSISERSLSTSFNLMKPLFVKAAALPASPVKRSQAQRPALKEQEGVPFPFTIQQLPPQKKKTKTQIQHTQKYDRAGPSPLHCWGWGK